jgi:hypothetical protein
MDYVNEDKISDIIKMMREDSSVAVVYPKKITGFDNRDTIHPDWIRMDFNKDNKYLINCQFAIWNKKALQELLKPGLSPWDLERIFKVPENCGYKFYCSPLGNIFSIEGDVFPYYFAIQKGYGIAKSKWLWNNKSFFKKENIFVDYNSLGTLSYFQFMVNKLSFKIKLMYNNAKAKLKYCRANK